MPPRSEQELLDATIELAIHCRWAVHHDRPARRSGGKWATAIQGHAGFPDLVLVRQGLVLFRELKGYSKTGRLGKLSPEQRDWARQLAQPTDSDPAWRGVGAPLFAVWTPDDWDTLIVPTLTSRVFTTKTDQEQR